MASSARRRAEAALVVLLVATSAAAGDPPSPLPTSFHTLGRALGETHVGGAIGGTWITQDDSDGSIIETQGYHADLIGEFAYGPWGALVELPVYVAKLGHTYAGVGPPRLEGYRRFAIPRGALFARARVRVPVQSFPDLERYDNPSMVFLSTYAQHLLERGVGDYLGVGGALTVRQSIGPVDVQADLQVDSDPNAFKTGPYFGLGLGVAYRTGDLALRGELVTIGSPFSNSLGVEGSRELNEGFAFTGALGIEWRRPQFSLGLSFVNPLDRYFRSNVHVVGVSVAVPLR